MGWLRGQFQFSRLVEAGSEAPRFKGSEWFDRSSEGEEVVPQITWRMQPVFESSKGSFGLVPSCMLNEACWLLGKWWLFHSWGLRHLSIRNDLSVFLSDGLWRMVSKELDWCEEVRLLGKQTLTLRRLGLSLFPMECSVEGFVLGCAGYVPFPLLWMTKVGLGSSGSNGGDGSLWVSVCCGRG